MNGEIIAEMKEWEKTDCRTGSKRGGDKEIWPCHSPPKLIEDTSTQATKTELL